MTKNGVEHRAARVSLVTGLSALLSIGIQLVSVPVCLHFWGAHAYGSWLAVFAASSLFRTVDGGYGVFVGNRINLLYHSDTVQLRKVLASAVVGTAILGLLQIALVIAAISFNGLGWLFGDQSLTRNSTASAALVVLVVTWVLSGSYLGIVHRLLIPAGLMYQAVWWSMAYQACVFLGVIAAAVLQLDLLGASLLIAGVQAFVYVASAVYMKNKLPGFFPWWRGAEWRSALSDLRGSSLFMLSGVLQQGGTNGAVLLVSATLGAAVLPVFTTVRTMVNLWSNVTTTLTSPLLPDVVRYHAHRQVNHILALTQAHAWLLGTVVNLGVLLAYPFLSLAYRLWTGGELELDRPLMAALLGAIVLANMGALMNLYLAGINHVSAVLGLSILRASLTLGLGVLLLPRLGLFGLGLAILIAEFSCLVATSISFFPQAIRQLGGDVDFRRFASSSASLVLTVYLLLTVAFGPEFPVMTYLFCLVAVLVLSWLGWRRLEGEVRQRLTRLVLRFVPVTIFARGS